MELELPLSNILGRRMLWMRAHGIFMKKQNVKTPQVLGQSPFTALFNSRNMSCFDEMARTYH